MIPHKNPGKAFVEKMLIKSGMGEGQAHMVSYQTSGAVLDVIMQMKSRLEIAEAADWQSIAQGEVEPLREATYKEVDAAMVKGVMASLKDEAVYATDPNPVRREPIVKTGKQINAEILDNRLTKLESQHKDWDAWARDTENVINEWRDAADKRISEQDDKIETLEAELERISNDHAARLYDLKKRLNKLESRGFFARLFNL